MNPRASLLNQLVYISNFGFAFHVSRMIIIIVKLYFKYTFHKITLPNEQIENLSNFLISHERVDL